MVTILQPMKHLSHLNTAVMLLGQYDGAQPFGIFLKDFFRANKKYGSKDRKRIGHLCYGYFRLGKALAGVPIEERILLGLYFSIRSPDELLQYFHPEWANAITSSLDDKLKLTLPDFDILSVFPYREFLSEDITPEKFSLSHLIQPSLYLRLRPEHEQDVIEKLEKAGVVTEKISEQCLVLPNSSKLEELIVLNKEAVVQDRSSQRVAEFFSFLDREASLKVWDCCAASGGKSIMAYDWNGRIDLTVTDIRESILANLRKRFGEAGIKKYKSQVMDLSKPLPAALQHSFGLVIADVPCTGSGTWSRTPEQLYYFQDKKIGEYSALQKKILINVMPALKPGGYFLYITCSVFREENETQTAFISASGLKLLRSEVLKGYESNADTMYAALFRRPL